MSDPGSGVSERWAAWRRGVSLDDYERRWEEMEEAGIAAHGEADFVTSLDPRPSTVLDAGCGTGRLARELARRGADVVGVDLDRDMLDHAARKAPDLTWVHGDLATADLGRTFDAVVMAGNVMVFCRPDDRPRIVANLARHVAPAGVLVAGSTVETAAGGFNPDEYDRDAQAAGLVAEARFSTWERDPDDHGRYVVTVHRRVGPADFAG
jgi:SAM-dependent methyltransferase